MWRRNKTKELKEETGKIGSRARGGRRGREEGEEEEKKRKEKPCPAQTERKNVK